MWAHQQITVQYKWKRFNYYRISGHDVGCIPDVRVEIINSFWIIKIKVTEKLTGFLYTQKSWISGQGIRLETKFDIRLETKFVLRLETKFDIRLETKFVLRLETKFYIRLETKFVLRLETKFYIRLETTFYIRLETKFNLRLETKLYTAGD